MSGNVDYSNGEQYIENCNEFSDYQTNYKYQNSSSFANNYSQLATPHSSLETSRQNSYERDERQYYDVSSFNNGQYQESSPPCEYEDNDLYYNSRPMKYLVKFSFILRKLL